MSLIHTPADVEEAYASRRRTGYRTEKPDLNISSKALNLKLGVTTQASSPSTHVVGAGDPEFKAGLSRECEATWATRDPVS